MFESAVKRLVLNCIDISVTRISGYYATTTTTATTVIVLSRILSCLLVVVVIIFFSYACLCFCCDCWFRAPATAVTCATCGNNNGAGIY